MSHQVARVNTRAALWMFRVARTSLVLILFVVCSLPYRVTDSIYADVTPLQKIRGIRVAHLAADSTPGRLDYVFGGGRNTPTSIFAYAPGGRLLFTIPADSQQPIHDIIDVIDLNGDGNAEIIAVHGGSSSTAPVLWIYNGDGSLKTKFVFDDGNGTLGLSLAPTSVRIYPVVPGNTQYRIAVVPDTFQLGYANSHNQSKVYFFDSNGSLLASPVVPGGGGEILTFPGVINGAIDTAGTDDNIVVVAKSRFMVFTQNGQKLYYKQFVDPNAGFTGYSTALDPWGGRRYGLYKLEDINGDGFLDLIVAADANSLDCVCSLHGGAYEAYLLSTSGQDGFASYQWRRTDLVGAHTGYTPSVPAGYERTVGVCMNGISDINMDGTVDIVVTDTDSSGNPFVRVINASTGGLTGYLIPGICLDVQRLDLTQPGKERDLIVFNPATGAHSIWRFNSGSYTPFQLSDDGTLSANVVLVKQSFPQEMSQTDDPHGLSGNGQFQATITKSNNMRALVGFGPASCPSGLKTWTVSAGATPNVNKSLDVNPRPGDIVNVMPVSDLTNYVWIINVENTCGTVTNTLRTYVQSGSTLVATDQLGDHLDAIGLYDPGSSTFHLRNSNSSGGDDLSFGFGGAGGGYVPLTGDWNGDGIDSIGLYDPATGAFFLRNSNSGGIADITFTYGPAGLGFIPLVGDWDGDGIDTIGLYDPAHAAFFLRNSNSGGIADITFAYGPPALGFIPIVGDWNGDGIDTIGLYDPAHAAFFLRNSNTGGVADITFAYGPPGLGFVPIVGDWNGDVVDTIGLYDPVNSGFFLRNSNSGGIADLTFSYGPAGWKPVTGNWAGL
jgi:hypothetical protein